MIGVFESMDVSCLSLATLIAVFLFVPIAPTNFAQYSATTFASTTMITTISTHDNPLDINSQQIGPDFAGKCVRGELTDVPGEELYVVGSDKRVV